MPSVDVQHGLAEFAALNRRRLFGSPPLEIEEMERFLELREALGRHCASGNDSGDVEIREERRSFRRLTTHLHVHFAGDGSTDRPGTVKDISQGGLFLQTSTPLPVGSPVCLVVDEDDVGRPLELRARVIWQRPPGEGEGRRPPGMGLAFEAVDEPARRTVHRLIQRATQRE